MRYEVNWGYSSSLVEGRLEAGQTIDLDERVAEAINVDSPGVLSRAGGYKPTSDRMARESTESRDWSPGGGDDIDDDTEVDELGLSPSIEDALVEAGYYTVGHVREADDEDLLALDGIGQVSLDKIREATA